MLNIKRTLFILAVIGLLLLGGCGFIVEQNEEIGEEVPNGAAGIMLAGQELPEVSGIIQSFVAEDEVIILVDGQEKTYRLSEDARNQVEEQSVAIGSEVTFSTYTIGDDKETIDSFK